MRIADFDTDRNPSTRIECLACGAPRIVEALVHGETGECPRCHYVGWTFSADLDGSVRRRIMNGGLAIPPLPRPHRPFRPR